MRLAPLCHPPVVTAQALLQYAETAARPLHDWPLVCLLLGLLAGSLLGLAVQPSPWWLGSLLLMTTLPLLWAWPAPRLRRCCRLGLFGLAWASLHLGWQTATLPPDHLLHHMPSGRQRVTIEGRLSRAIESRGDRQYVYLHLLRLQHKDQDWQAVRGLIRLNVQATALPFLPGDVIHVTRLRLHPVHSLGNPGGFDFQAFMHRQGIYAVGGVSNSQRLSLQQRPAGLYLARTVEQWRQHVRATIQAHMTAPYAAVFLAMVLGQRGDMPTEIADSFRHTGVAHLLVVSGLHVGFVAASLLWGWRHLLRALRSRLPRAWLPGWRPTPLAALLSMPLVLLYCLLVGWHIPTTRAALMVASYLLALQLDRSRHALYALVLAAVLILGLDPQALADLSFQLSFAAMAAILLTSQALRLSPAMPEEPGGDLLEPPSTLAQHWSRWRQRLRAALCVSLAAYGATLPILAGTFHTLPTLGVVANLLLVPLAGVVIPAGVGSLVVLVVWPSLLPGVLALLQFPLAWMVTLTATLAHVPGSQVHLAAPSPLMCLSYYGLLGSILVRRSWPWRRWATGGCAGLLVLGVGWQYLQTRPRQLQVTFLDIGTGDAIFVQVPGPHYLLIDGGGTYDGRFDTGAQVIAPFLWDHYVRRFDLLALTHTHPNHARGLASISRLFPTRQVLTNGSPMQAPYLRELLATQRRWGTAHDTAFTAPRHWQWERLHLTLLSPPTLKEQQETGWNPTAENDRSLVLRLQYGDMRLLLTGDIEHASERWLLAHRADLQADILHIPHHGSRTSTLPAFVERVQPRHGIISLGAHNPYGHPHARVLETLAAQHVQVWRTDLHGAITIHSNGTGYHITSFRPYVPVADTGTR